jgi:tetratricopeptide (TPR) repeat protein
MSCTRRAFVIMPFGRKKTSEGLEIDFDAVYNGLFAPAIKAAGLTPHRADADREGGSIHLDMFQDLLLAEFVVADLTLDNPNVWYEIGVRHALRAGGTVLTYSLRDRLPFDIAGQRMQHYTLLQGQLDPSRMEAEQNAIKEAVTATLGAWRGRRVSPVYQQLPNLREPDWKTLKVGAVNEYWDALEEWQSRLRIASGKQSPGDILVFADETPNSILEFEALRSAAKALLDLRRPNYALAIVQRALKINPDDIKARQLEGTALGRAQRFAEAREKLRRLTNECNDGESHGIFARTWKDEWTQIWNAHLKRQQDPLEAARDSSAPLQNAAAAYALAFQVAPNDYYPGINALTLGRLWEHITGRRSELPLDAIAGGVAWCVVAALSRGKTYWSVATRAELALVENRKEDAIKDYSEAAALAVADRDRFALDSSSQQLDVLGALNFRPDIVAAAAEVIDRAEKQLDLLVGIRIPTSEPAKVVVFSGHMVDDPKIRGAGKEKRPRFPDSKAASAAVRIRAALDKLGVQAGDLGVCGGACGGDLLFAEACLERGVRVELRLAKEEADFLAQSVTFADPDRRWENTFLRVSDHANTQKLIMPQELGPPPDQTLVHARCNRWMLYSALSRGLSKVFFLTLWDGAEGDGPGGTKQMVDLVKELTGRNPEVIDPAGL